MDAAGVAEPGVQHPFDGEVPGAADVDVLAGPVPGVLVDDRAEGGGDRSVEHGPLLQGPGDKGRQR